MGKSRKIAVGDFDPLDHIDQMAKARTKDQAKFRRCVPCKGLYLSGEGFNVL
jgi:hypothetical protein